MNKTKLFKRMAVLIISIFLINSIATKFYWYSSIFWFDMFMHFLGGFWLGLVFLWFFSFKQDLNFSKSKFFTKDTIKIILSVIFVGLLWEFFEILVNETLARNPFDLWDTLSDLFFDLIGGFFAIFYFSKRIMYREENRV